jgi:hypothetical protein
LNTSDFEIHDLVRLLRRSEKDSDVQNAFGQAISNIVRDEYYGSIELKNDGLEAVFKEATWMVPEAAVVDPKDLYLAAFHLHRDGHEGYSGYAGQLPNGVALGDPEGEVVRKMGQPAATGGGGMSSVLKRAIPRWLEYPIDDAYLHFQLAPDGRVEMASLSATSEHLAARGA